MWNAAADRGKHDRHVPRRRFGVRAVAEEPAARNEFRRGWPVIVACFVLAIFSWGFGFYGQAVYLAELQRINGWSTSLTSAAATTYYLVGAFFLASAHVLLQRRDLRPVLIGGALLLGLGAIAIANAHEPWQLFAASLLMALGWAVTSSTAIATTLARWFDRRRGLALSLALNGASASGLSIAPALVYLSHRIGLAPAVEMVACGLILLLVPLLILGLRHPPPAPSAHAAAGAASAPVPDGSAPTNWREAFRSRLFWSLAAPFALAFTAQAGFLVHQVAILLPRLGPAETSFALILGSSAAVSGRFTLGFFVDRLNQRLLTAVSVLSQAVALGAIIVWPDVPTVLYVAVAVFGISVGNLITLPALIVQREFATQSFALVVSLSTAVGQFVYAFAPAMLGIVHDLFGGYGPALGLCIALQVMAAATVIRRRA